MNVTFRKAQWVVLGITATMGTLGIIYYLLLIPQSLFILNTDAITFISPLAGVSYTIDDTVEVTVVFDPAVIGGEASGYYLVASSPDKVFFREKVIGLSYTTQFTLTRDFIADLPTESLTIRAEMTIDSETYYNELNVSVIDPYAEISIETISVVVKQKRGIKYQ